MSPASLLERRRGEVDHRIAQRRRQVAADRRRRWLRRTGAVAAVLALVAGAAALTRTPLLDVDELLVRGHVRTPEAAVLAARGLAVGDPILELDEAGAEAAVRALPWVADADVSRSWRDGHSKPCSV